MRSNGGQTTLRTGEGYTVTGLELLLGPEEVVVAHASRAVDPAARAACTHQRGLGLQGSAILLRKICGLELGVVVDGGDLVELESLDAGSENERQESEENGLHQHGGRGREEG